jgi:hypothetical protein
VRPQARGREVGNADARDEARVTLLDDDIVIDLGGLGGGVEDGGVVAAGAGGRGQISMLEFKAQGARKLRKLGRCLLDGG